MKKKAAPPKKRRTQRERRESTMRRLVDATIDSLLAVGYTRTTVKEVCGRAGLSHGALFRFFPTVLDLVLAAGEEIAVRQIASFESRFAKAMRSASDPFAPALELLRETCRSETNMVFYELLVAARTDRALRRALEPAMRRYYERIRETARKVPGTSDLPPEMLEVLLFSAIHLFDGESLARVVWRKPELENQRMVLLLGALNTARAFSGTKR